eukprot:5102356-Pyramimonas_sp.AAC.1
MVMMMMMMMMMMVLTSNSSGRRLGPLLALRHPRGPLAYVAGNGGVSDTFASTQLFSAQGGRMGSSSQEDWGCPEDGPVAT